MAVISNYPQALLDEHHHWHNPAAVESWTAIPSAMNNPESTGWNRTRTTPLSKYFSIYHGRDERLEQHPDVPGTTHHHE